ncbi:MAG: glycosyltransferase family 9 protein [Rhodospirillales bacterium]|jgi:ADP-heptose:LPS heptosyltransferase|nr:glycosyltransferase family 9 protein [Rhodospirillales bacterium]
METGPSRILVIKLGALGDLVQAFGPFAAIRRHHEDAHITLLTSPPYAAFAEASGLFDQVWWDSRPKFSQLVEWLALRHRLRAGSFERVYDLQTSDRSSFYFRLFWPGPTPEWSGIAKGCSHPHANAKRDLMHTVERQAEQLGMAGIETVPAPDFSWVAADVARFDLPGRYALLVPGGAPHRPAKRWPVERYGELANWLFRQGILPVLIGTQAEGDILAAISEACPQSRSLAGKTDFLDIAALAHGAVSAVGNDTGPMHLIAAAGCASVVLYSGESDPALCAQRGPRVAVLRRTSLDDLAPPQVEKVLAALWQERTTS